MWFKSPNRDGEMHQSNTFLLHCFLAIASLPLLSGCGPSKPEIVPVTGVVTLDGRPVEKAGVALVPPGELSGLLPACGLTDAEGNVSLTTEKVGSGVVPGDYQITVTKKETTGMLADKKGLEGGIAPGGFKVRWLIPQKYASPTTSGMTVQVKSGMEPLKIELKSQ